MIGRKLGMMRLYDGSGRVRPVTVLQLGPNRVTQVRNGERDGYEAVQIGFLGNRKRLTRPQRGHLSRAGIEGEALSALREFPADDVGEHEAGQVVTCDQFEPGQYVDVTGTSKGRGFAGTVKRWGFHGGPKTHGQSDRHRAPGSVGAGTTPGKVWKGQKMGGHMGAETVSVLNLLVVQSDPARHLLFVEGSVPGPNKGLITVTPGRKPPLEDYKPPELPAPPEVQAKAPEPADDEEPESIVDEAVVDGATSDEESVEAGDAAEDEAPEADEVEHDEADDEAGGEDEPPTDAPAEDEAEDDEEDAPAEDEDEQDEPEGERD